MKVCDTHTDRKAADTVHIVSEDTHADVCEECRDKVRGILSKHEEPKKRRWFGKDSATAE